MNIDRVGETTFVGRLQEMAALHRELQRTDRVAISAIAGMGGVGKTELAKRYATTHQTDYPGGACWLRAREADPSIQLLEFVRLRLNQEIPQERNGQPLTAAQQVAWCWDNWQPAEGRVLLVLDDVAEAADLDTCRPFLEAIPPRFRVLMTTRLRPDRSFFALALDVLAPDAALDLLASLLGNERLAREPDTAADLCDRLGYLPLGLELVGRYLDADPDLSLAAMVQRLEAHKLADAAIDLDEAQVQEQYFMTAQRGVRAAIALSWEKLAHQKRFQAAEPLLLQALHIFEQRLGASHPHTVSTRQSLDTLYQQMQLRNAPPAPQSVWLRGLRRFLQGCRRVWGWLTRLWRRR